MNLVRVTSLSLKGGIDSVSLDLQLVAVALLQFLKIQKERMYIELTASEMLN